MLKKVELKQKNKELAATGISIGEIHDPLKSRPVLMCLIRSLLIFLACEGTTDGFCACFNIPYNKGNVLLFMVFISFFMGFLYFNKLTFYIGYVLLLGTFSIQLIRYYLYANSGFQAIVNIIRQEFSDHFDLSVMRQAEEFYENRYVTVTIALYFLLVFLAMLLNVTISRYMSLLETILVTFIFLEIPLYIGLIPPVPQLLSLLTCYISVALIRVGTNSRMVVGGKNAHEFVRYKWKNKKYYTYQGHAKNNIIIIGFSFVLAFLVLIFKPLWSNTTERDTHNQVKEYTDEYVKTLVQVGISGWFDRYSSVGGINNGHLGGVSSIRPDFETDLTVSFVPLNNKTVYLREFKGSFYNNSNWYSDSLAQNKDGSFRTLLTIDQIDEYDEIAARNAAKNSGITTKMQIENVDGAINHYYLPYRTFFEDLNYVKKSDKDFFEAVPSDRRYPVFPKDKLLSLTYSPFTEDSFSVPEADIPLAEIFNDNSSFREYQNYVYNSCTEVPENLNSYLYDFCMDKDYFGLDILLNRNKKYIYSKTSYEDVNDFRIKACQGIYQMFLDEYPYTLSPGTTPRFEDFVEYFLEYQKRGFCAHFAASSVMLLRHLGIPARYVEGYCIPSSLVRESGTPVDAEVNEWYQNSSESITTADGSKNQTSDNLRVVSVDVSDYYAHAWIEVYLEGYGFVPVEMTPPSYEATPTPSTQGGLAGLFASLMSVDLNLGLGGGTPDVTTNQNQVGSVTTELSSIDGSSIFAPVLLVFALVLIILAIWLIIVKTAPSRKLRKYLKNEQYDLYLYLLFEQFTKFLFAKELTTAQNPLPLEVAEIVNTNFELLRANLGIKDPKNLSSLLEKYKNEKVSQLFAYFEEMLYSTAKPERDKCLEFKEDLTTIKKILRKTLKQIKNKK